MIAVFFPSLFCFLLCFGLDFEFEFEFEMRFEYDGGVGGDGDCKRVGWKAGWLLLS